MAKIEELLKNRFIQNKSTLSVAESCTGGLICHRITNISGTSGFFKLGVTAYSNSAKIDILGVPERVIGKYGAVSAECALYMAKGARRMGKSDFGAGVTGIAGPDGGTKLKPVGTVFIAVNYKGKSICRKFLFKGGRLSIKEQSAEAALKTVILCLKRKI